MTQRFSTLSDQLKFYRETQRFATLADQLDFYREKYLCFYMPGKNWNYQMQQEMEKVNPVLHNHLQGIARNIDAENDAKNTVAPAPIPGKTRGHNTTFQEDRVKYAKTVILKVDDTVWDSLPAWEQLTALRSVPLDFAGDRPT